ncbi:methyltransferase of ATP-grasp peptide maturase system [Streptomyces sp. 3212.3]|uniref:ATP-grasp peptide maturase system methyltransferase n=1 Tax=Streptomyces sp. 3212.3 TaxID=1938846 RepID=UPI000E3827E2|nr:ATP-grasp peptide maturase system methyltransferase [Streptomyces sp. 3212.3]REE61435.1 methyltransferase of ATP-grasp peptide maturase system [Streptomyces sp. 3212.3]
MTSQALRDALADRLKASGDLDDPDWERAARTVPREAFVSGGFLRALPATPSTLYAPVRPDDDGWLEGVYSDDTLITQLDGHLRAVDLIAPQGGDPTSSSTLPSLVLRMWQQLGVTSGQRVLEIGTGTGYSTGLGCERLGSANITSVEYDPENAEQAAAGLKELGYAPDLRVGDGLDASVIDGDYHALIATCSVRHIPYAWLDQVRVGGTVLATIAGWMGAYGLVKLTVTGRGQATGQFLPGTTSFMIARPHSRPPRPPLVMLPGQTRPAEAQPAWMDDWTMRWVAQLAAPSAERLGGGDFQVLSDVATGSQAWFSTDEEGRRLVTQRGPIPLWDRVEDALGVWKRAGSRPQSAFGMTITPDAQWVWIGDEGGPAWRLPV